MYKDTESLGPILSSPARALAWELSSRHRWGLAAVLVYLGALGALKLLVLGPGRRLALDSELEFALLVIVPLAASFTYMLATFSFGLEGDIAGRRSLYPQRLFRLPLSSRALAGWPMLFGTIAIALLWLATRALGLWPAEATVPWLWPGVLAAVMLSWTQVLSWTPLAIRGLRVALAVCWLGSLAFGTLLALYLEASEGLMILLLLPHLPLAFLAATASVSAARRGARSLWSRPVELRIENAVTPQRAFKSPARAQLWLEWHRFGRSLPLLTAIVIPLELVLMFAFADTARVVRATAIVGLLTPAFLASFVAATARRTSEASDDDSELSPFLARRPMSSSGLVLARLGAAALSVAATWLLVLGLLPAALWASGNLQVLEDQIRLLVEIFGPRRAYAAGALALAAPVALTWVQLTQSLVVGLSGRKWLVKASVFGTLVLLTLAVLLVPRAVESPSVLAWIWRSLPAALSLLVVARVSSASWVFGRLLERRLVAESRLVVIASLWVLAVLGLFAALVWLVPSVLFPRHQLLLLALAMVPLARLSATPLALDWSRHR